MTFDDLETGETIFLDTNTLVYHFIPFPVLGSLCTKLIERVTCNELTAFREAIERIPKLGIHVVAIPVDLVAKAASVSIQYGLLSNDALTVAVMQHLGLTNIASNDADFDRVPGLARYAPA
ncbi:MAG: type II toxin-antitoxin system VapC family toxin [Bythopirellula sp.]|nr:type II toxin-antitoxin system VapC family toxin [Bythopirellula sp.]